MWHCPHCGAPQAETARCWVCRRSSTTCSTCRHFRRALAGDLGYCALDPRREPLTGHELRGCWAPRSATATDSGPAAPPLPEAHRLRGGRGYAATPGERAGAPTSRAFVPIEDLVPPGGPAPDHLPVSSALDAVPAFIMEPDERWAERTSLFGDAEG